MESYVTVKNIGEGSFGRAILVRRKEDGKQYVMKEICISKMNSKERIEAKKEVEVLSKLKHPNIVTYRESFQASGNLYIVMDFCESGDMYQMIAKQRGIKMEEAKVLDLFVQCCLAVKHIHDRKILHRDIKTQNIFLTKHGMVKLGDFGIARVLKSTMEFARTCIGTPYYLSPEIVENRPYNNKSDIWSLGCVLYELATLKHAFEAGSMKNLVMKIIRGSYPPVPNKYSDELKSLIAHCLKRDPIDRPSINTLLKKTIIQRRLSKFLTPELEDKDMLIEGKKNIQRIPSARKNNDPAAIYGVSVAKKTSPVRAPQRKRPYAHNFVKVGNNKRQELVIRERKRQELLNQELQYQQHMEKMQRKRWQNLQAGEINKAREEGWRNVLKTKDPPAEIHHANEEKDRMYYQEEKPGFVPHQIRNAFQENTKDEDIEQVKLLNDFRQGRRKAEMNKVRYMGDAVAQQKDEPPLLKFHRNEMARYHEKEAANEPLVKMVGRNKKEMEYLKQLEHIRHQNYHERKRLIPPRSKVEAAEIRHQKIAALRAQAEERAKWLRMESEMRRNALKINEMQQTKIIAKPVVVAEVGIDTAIRQVQPPKMFRSCSEGDIQDMLKDGNKAARKQWPGGSALERLQDASLEINGSEMEATEAQYEEPVKELSEGRHCWSPGVKSDLISALHNIKLSQSNQTTVIVPGSSVDVEGIKIQTDVVQEPGQRKIAWSVVGVETNNPTQKHDDVSKSVTKCLALGVYDTPKKLLRTCSLPILTDAPSTHIESFENSPEVILEEKIEEEDFEHMLESMRSVLNSQDKFVVKETQEDVVDSDSDWETDEPNATSQPQRSSVKYKKENIFSNIEESRVALEDELGIDMFKKIYRHIQMIQDNENDELNIESKLTGFLGDREHLYQKVLYLVIADSAYCEGNDC